MTHLFLSLSLHSVSTYHYCFFKSAVIVILLSPAFIFSSNKHRCSHTLILTFKNLSFYKSGEIYPLLSLSLPSAAPTQPLAHYFIVFSLFLLPSLTHPLSFPPLCQVLLLSFSHLRVLLYASKHLSQVPQNAMQVHVHVSCCSSLDFSLFCSTSLTLWICLKTR